MATTQPGKLTFYKRPLPCPPAIEFSSAEGRKLFRDALAGGLCEGFFKLVEQFMTQDESTFCGLASIAMVLNALAIDPRRPWRGAWRYFHDTMLDCCLPLEVIKQQGITLEQAACLARCNGAQVSSYRFGTFTVDEFRRQVEEVCRTGQNHIIVSYSRRTFLQTGDGHFSPIGTYHAEKDLVLILDVARFKYPPHWVPLPLLVEAMSALDPSTQQPRGYMLLAPRAPIPVAFTLDISHPSASTWSSALRFLDTHAPQLLASIQSSRASGTPVSVAYVFHSTEAMTLNGPTPSVRSLEQQLQGSSTSSQMVPAQWLQSNGCSTSSASSATQSLAQEESAGSAPAAAPLPATGAGGSGRHGGVPATVEVAAKGEGEATKQRPHLLQLPPDAGPEEVLPALMRMVPLVGVDMLLAVRKKALMQDVQDPSACMVCDPLLKQARAEQQQRQLGGNQHADQPQAQAEQKQQRLLTAAPHSTQQPLQQQTGQQGHQQQGQAPPLLQQGQQQQPPDQQQQTVPHSDPKQQLGQHAGSASIPPKCMGGGGHCTEAACGGASGPPTKSHILRHVGGGADTHIHASSNSQGPAGGAHAHGSTPHTSHDDAAHKNHVSNHDLSSNSGAGGGCGSGGCGSGPGVQGAGQCPQGAGTMADGCDGSSPNACPLGVQDPVIQELRTTELFEAVQTYLTTAPADRALAPLHAYFQKQHLLQPEQQQQELEQQQQQLSTFGEPSAGTRYPARQVCTLHMVSKVAMLLLLCGLEHPNWSGLWSMGSPEGQQWWLWVGKPLETLPLLSAEVKYLRLQLNEVQKILLVQGEQWETTNT